MGKILAFIYKDMADFELTMAVTAVSWIKKELITIAYEKEVVTAKAGITYKPHMTVEESLSLDDVEGLIIPGGWNNELRPELKELINKLNQENKLLAAICAGPQYLAKSGVLIDKKYTTTLTEEYFKTQNLEDFFPRDNYVKQNVVRDQNIVTAIGRSFIDFAFEILDYFNAFKDQEEKDQITAHYKGL